MSQSTTFLNTHRNHIINCPGFLRLFNAMPLFVACPQIKKQSDGHEPKFLCIHTHLNCSIIKKPGKDFSVRYPTSTFFDAAPLETFSSSLSMSRLVPLNIASVIAFLYAAKSTGEVRS